MRVMIYYDKKSQNILDFFPTNLSEDKKEKIRQLWNQEICRKILLLLSQKDDITAPVIKDEIGHSMSTLHENIKKLEEAGLIEAKMVYTGNKQKIISANVLCVSKNATLTEKITRFLNQGLWVDTDRSSKIIDFLNKNHNEYFSVEEISAKTGIQVDEVQTLLENWNSQITRGFTDFLKKVPFERKVLYKGKK